MTNNLQTKGALVCLSAACISLSTNRYITMHHVRCARGCRSVAYYFVLCLIFARPLGGRKHTFRPWSCADYSPKFTGVTGTSTVAGYELVGDCVPNLSHGSLGVLSAALQNMSKAVGITNVVMLAHCESNWRQQINGCWQLKDTLSGKVSTTPVSYMAGLDVLFEDKSVFCSKANNFGQATPPCLSTGAALNLNLRVWLNSEAEAFEKFIWKPSGGSGGHGIKLLNRESLLHESKLPTGVIQGFVDRPVLYNGYKTDVRVFAVVVSLRPFRVYLSRTGMFRSTYPGLKYNASSLKALEMHITNCHFGKRIKNFIVNRDPAEQEQATFGTLTKFWKSVLVQNGLDEEAVFQRMKEKVAMSLLSLHSDMMTSNFDNSSTIILFDAIVDQAGEVFIMETDVNAYIFKKAGFCSGSDVVVSSELYKTVINGMSLQYYARLLRESVAPTCSTCVLQSLKKEKEFASGVMYESVW